MRARRVSASDRQRKPGRSALLIEYGLIVALLTAGAIAVVKTFGVDLGPSFHNSSTNRAV